MCKKKCNFAAKLIEMMKKKFFQILIWLGILFGCTVLAALIWILIFGKNDSIAAQKWLQFISVIGMFVAPPIICATIWDEHHQPQHWLKIDRGTDWTHYLMAVGVMIVAVPAINLFAYLNSLIPMPESLVTKEADANKTIELFLQADNFGLKLLNIGLLALLPAFAEELTFRGTLQQILSPNPLTTNPLNRHMAIWVTAILFSAIHMQFLGFIPRMLMGALFGYMFVWTGTLWIPILMHFTNNAFAISAYYLMANRQGQIANSTNIADTLGTGDTLWMGILSLILTSLGLLIFYRRTHTR